MSLLFVLGMSDLEVEALWERVSTRLGGDHRQEDWIRSLRSDSAVFRTVRVVAGM